MTQQASQYSVQQAQDAHQDLSQAGSLFRSGDAEGAIEACKALIETYPDYARAHVMAGVIYMQHSNYAAALPHLVRARLINPNDPTVLGNLGKVHLELGATHCAVEALQKAIALTPNESMPHYFMGEVCLTQNDYAGAADHFETALAHDRDNTSAKIRLGHCQASIGRYDEALSTLKAILAQSVTPHEKAHIFQILADFPIPLEGIDLISELDALEQEAADNPDPTQAVQYFTPTITLADLSMAFARAITFDKLGRHKEAWDAFAKANRRIANETIPQRQVYFTQGEALFERADQWQPRGNGKQRQPAQEEPVSLFILGPSRVGKTTLERLVGALDGVRLGSEHTIVRDTAQKTSQRAGLLSERFLANLPSDADELISEIYDNALAAFADGARLVTVTHPGVISDVGRLSDLVPNARFVFLKRNHDDIAFRIFAYLYQANTNQFAYDIKDIYRYLELHDRMVDMWAAKIGDRALVLSYEDMVADPGATLARVAKLCGMTAPAKPDVEISGDVGCATPYREWLHDARDQKA